MLELLWALSVAVLIGALVFFLDIVIKVEYGKPSYEQELVYNNRLVYIAITYNVAVVCCVVLWMMIN